MKELTNKDLLAIYGGVNITGSLVAAAVKGVEIILELGRSLGAAIRYAGENKICPIK